MAYSNRICLNGKSGYSEPMQKRKAKSFALKDLELNTRAAADAFAVVARQYTAEATKSPEAALRALVKTGILTKSGRLSRRYAQKKA